VIGILIGDSGNIDATRANHVNGKLRLETFNLLIRYADKRKHSIAIFNVRKIMIRRFVAQRSANEHSHRPQTLSHRSDFSFPFCSKLIVMQNVTHNGRTMIGWHRVHRPYDVIGLASYRRNAAVVFADE
jgi:hypothetical protein